MKISKILEFNYKYVEYDFNDAVYLVSDGSHEVRCRDTLLAYQVPKVGMSVKALYACSYADTIDLIISKNRNYYIQKDKKTYFKYKVCGTIEDHKKALIKVFDFIISLEYYYPDGFNFFLQDGYVEFEVDVFDCDSSDIFDFCD